MPFSSLSSCAICTNQPSISSCEGCKRKFCLTCLTQHRNELSLELDDLFNLRNELVQTMNNQLPNNNNTNECSCFDAINYWQKEMHANIDRIAATARNNVRQLLSDASRNVRTKLDQISKELQQKQKTGGYVENDLYRLKQELNRLNDLVKDFNEQIHINTDISKTIAWDSLIFVVPREESSPSPPPPYTPSNPFLNNSSQQDFFIPTSVYHSRSNSNRSTIPLERQPTMTSNVSTPAYMPYSNGVNRPYNQNTSSGFGNQRPSTVNRHSVPSTFKCIGCKSDNNVNPSGPSICKVCRSPANF